MTKKVLLVAVGLAVAGVLIYFVAMRPSQKPAPIKPQQSQPELKQPIEPRYEPRVTVGSARFVPVREPCFACGGTGIRVWLTCQVCKGNKGWTQVCPTCRGTGRIVRGAVVGVSETIIGGSVVVGGAVDVCQTCSGTGYVWVVCPNCGGTGAVGEVCAACSGRGYVINYRWE